MKNILYIMRHDMRKVTSSIVALVFILGLCIVPCLYAWFNIFSNWSPYDSQATGRIKVAISSSDEGVTLMGLNINVGDKIVEALEANDTIGWVRIDSSESAVEGVRSGAYYAALVIPDDFSEDVISFIDGDLINPVIIYYVNEKKNAIAPKITGKAEAAVRDQVNSTFVETLADYASKGVSVGEATGIDPEDVLNKVGSRVEDLSERLESCLVITNAAVGLSTSAHDLLSTSDTLIDSSRDVLAQNKKLLDETSDSLAKAPYAGKDEEEKAAKQAEKILAVVDKINTMLGRVIDGKITYTVFVKNFLPSYQKEINDIKRDVETRASDLTKAGFTVLGRKHKELASILGEIAQDLEDMKSVDPEDIDAREAAIKSLEDDLTRAGKSIESIREFITANADAKYNKALSDTQDALEAVTDMVSLTYKDLGKVNSTLSSYNSSLDTLESSLSVTDDSIKSIQESMGSTAGIMYDAAGSKLLSELGNILGNDDEALAEYISSPVKMDSEVIYPIREYGSAMAPFYTVLAQWVGALLTAVLIKVRVRKEGELADLRLHEHFFGRYGLYLFVGLSQALIVSLGDLLYIGIQCVSPVRFVLAACLNGIAFTMINYALVFALDNIGMAIGVIVLLMQVAGSGGTFPVEVLPEVFRGLYPIMPFHYSMDAMRECIAGMYGHTYAKCMGMLCLFIVISIVFGMCLHYPAGKLNRIIAESKEDSGIML